MNSKTNFNPYQKKVLQQSTAIINNSFKFLLKFLMTDG